VRIKYTVMGLILGVLLSSVAVVLAGSLDSPDVPGNTESFTLEDIWNRLDSGAAGTKTTFTEPGAGPGSGTMHTLNDIMAKAPMTHANAATPTHVLAGKVFWGLDSGAWATQTGSLHGGCTCEGSTDCMGRFCDNGDGTITDLTTCLVWLKKADWGGAKEWGAAHTRAVELKAGAAAAGLSDGSVKGDWRLPTKSELDHLINGSPVIHCDGYQCTLCGFTDVWGRQGGVGGEYYQVEYWTTTPNENNVAQAWVVETYDGDMNTVPKSETNDVWPVRGGQ